MHRDIKPGNLLVAAGGTTKITDFGIATAMAAAQASHLTETGMVMGTAMYVSPEQATGAPVDASSDIYSLGVVAYECLAGHVPFTATEPLAIAYAHKHAPVPPLPPDVPPPVANLVYDMLAKTPAGRPANARVVADRAEMLRDAVAFGDARPGAPSQVGLPGATRADLPAAATGLMPGDDVEPGLSEAALTGPDGPGTPGAPGGRRLVLAGLTAVLCALAALAGLYLSGHLIRPASHVTGPNAVQHVSSSASAAAPSTSDSTTSSPSPSTVEPPSSSPSPTDNPEPSKTAKPTTSPKSTATSASPTASGSGSGSPTDSGSPSSSPSSGTSSSPST